ncbi:MAG: GNAT family N-acetyltransferase [Pseudomonadales bacterium]
MEAPAPTLKLASLKEAKTIASLSRDEIEAGLGWRWRVEAITAMIRDPDAIVVCAHVPMDNDTIQHFAGFGIMQFELDHAHLNLLAVAPKYRRQGIARELLQWLEKTALVAGIDTVTLEVRAVNVPARAFYRDAGYQENEYLRRYYRTPDGKTEAAYRMRRSLRQGRFRRA